MMLRIPLPFIGPPPNRKTHVEAQLTVFDPARWKAALDRLDPHWWPAALDQLNGKINRSDVFRMQDSANQPAGAAHVFIASTVWGSGNRRFTFRTKACQSGFAPVASLLAQAAARARVDDPVDVFGALAQGPLYIKHLGPSYFTKFLYFAGYKANTTHRQPLIFDERVRGALLTLCGLQLGNSRGDYDTYLNLIHDWASQWQTEPDVVERVLFTIGFSSGLAVDVLLGRQPRKDR